MTQLKIKSIIGTLVVLGVIVPWASGNKEPRGSGLMYNKDDVSNCLHSCQTRWGCFFWLFKLQSRGLYTLQKIR